MTLLVVGALRRELRGAVARDEVRVLRCGVGRPGADRAVAALTELRPRMVLHVGHAGGLRAGLVEGDLVLVTEVFGAGEPAAPMLAAAVDPLRAALARLPHRLAQGGLVTVPAFVHSAAEKATLAERHQAVACDMEAAWLAWACATSGIPYCGVRAISDAADRDVLPALRGPSGPDPIRLFRAITRPGAPLRAARMLRGASRADGALAAALPVAIDALRRSGR